MITKRIKASLLCGCLATMLISSPIFAQSYVSGTSTGGSLGKATCNGSMAIGHSGGYYVTGATNTNTSSGIKAVNITVHYVGLPSESKDFSGYAASVSGRVNLRTSNAISSISGRHSFSSSEYGQWYGETQINNP